MEAAALASEKMSAFIASLPCRSAPTQNLSGLSSESPISSRHPRLLARSSFLATDRLPKAQFSTSATLFSTSSKKVPVSCEAVRYVAPASDTEWTAVVSSSRPLPDFDNLTFSLTPTDSIYVSNGEWSKVGSTDAADVKWDSGEMRPFGDLQLSPAAAFMSYGLGIFEGMKAQRTKDNRVLLFRPDANARRFQTSAERLLMAPFPTDQFVDAVVETVQKNIRFVPPADKGSFYVRPQQHAVEPILGLAPNVLFLVTIYGSPVGSYFSGKRAAAADKGLRLRALRQSRVAAGGTGAAKCMGNYAGGIYVAHNWKTQGYDDVLYLDAWELKNVTETSGSNFFCRMRDGTIVTPSLDDQILAGVTRDSVIQVARKVYGLNVVERPLSFEEVIADGVEVFCTGTAWTVREVGEIDYMDASGVLKTKKFEQMPEDKVQTGILKTLQGIQRGEIADEFGWIREVEY